jgi:hypothetical protein
LLVSGRVLFLIGSARPPVGFEEIPDDQWSVRSNVVNFTSTSSQCSKKADDAINPSQTNAVTIFISSLAAFGMFA